MGQYRVLSRLGAGEVYLAEDTQPGSRRVALRLLPAELRARDLRQLSHPNIAQVFDTGPGYIASEYIEGTLLDSSGALSEARVIDLGIEAADALDEAHARGIVHGHVKPENLLVTAGGHIKILDFGVPPEGEPGKRDDVTALCAVLRRAVDTPGPELERVLARGSDYQNAADLRTELKRLAVPPAAAKAAPRWKRRAAIVAAAAAALAIGNWIFDLLRKPAATNARAARLTSYPGAETYPSFSPDGTQVAFAWMGRSREEGSHLFVARPGSGTPVQITRGPAADTAPAWSPDGKWVAFIRETAESAAYYVAAPGGGEQRKLADAPRPVQAAGRPSWMPDSAALAVTLKPDDKAQRIVLVPGAGGEPRALTDPPTGSPGDSQPAISPDGRTLAFLRRPSATAEGDIWVAPLAGGEARRITFDNAGVDGIAWTHNGREVVYASSRSIGSARLWRLPVAGGTPKLVAGGPDGEDITGGIAEAHQPAVTRAGTRLAYSHMGHRANIWRYDLTAKDPSASAVRLIASSSADRDPAWSPDGKRIAFLSERSGTPQVWVCDSEGGNPVQVTHIGEGRISPPCWSPDGRLIAFALRGPEGTEIWSLNPDRKAPTRVHLERGDNTPPSWSHDGQWIYHMRRGRVWKMKPDGGSAKQISEEGGSAPQESVDGKSLYYIKDHAVYRMPVNGGDEERLGEINARGPSAWVVLRKGIAFVEWEMHRRGAESEVRFLDFATRRVTRLASLAGLYWYGSTTISVSADGRYLLYSRMDQAEADVMMIDGFR